MLGSPWQMRYAGTRLFADRTPTRKRSSPGRAKVTLLYLAWCLNGRPCKSLLNDQHGRFWRSFLNWVPKTTATAHLCPPCLSTMTRRVYTSRLSFPQWHGYLRKRTFHQGHTKTAWRNDITFPKLYIVASLMKHHYSNESFCRGQGTPLHLEFIEFLIRKSESTWGNILL